MIYFAILLILVGLFFLLIALFSESARKNNRKESRELTSPEEEYPLSGEPEDIEIAFPKEEVYSRTKEDDRFELLDESDEDLSLKLESDSYLDDDASIMEEEVLDTGPLVDLENIGAKKTQSDSLTHKMQDDAIYSVLFDDRSGIIDYNNLQDINLAEISSYKNIKRIGRGEVRLDDDGISFYMDNKLYRFDFYKLEDLWAGDGFLALPLKGGSSVKLFLIENDKNFSDKASIFFQEFLKGR